MLRDQLGPGSANSLAVCAFEMPTQFSWLGGFYELVDHWEGRSFQPPPHWTIQFKCAVLLVARDLDSFYAACRTK